MKTWVKIEKTDKDRQDIVNLQAAYGLLKYHKNDKKVLLIELQNDRAVLQYMKGYKEPYRVFSDAMDRENSKVGQFKTITTAKKAFEEIIK